MATLKIRKRRMAAPFMGQGSRVAEMGAAIKTRISKSARLQC